MVSSSADREIKTVKIFPSIGVARVGNSDEHFVGPEVPDPQPHSHAYYRDGNGRLKRQAACFRIYGFDGDGQLVREITAAEADITWSVHLANKKAAWYQFHFPLDVPAAAEASQPTLLRNAAVTDRSRLKIGPAKPVTISSRDPNAAIRDYSFTGHFLDLEEEIYLGELRIDKEGRLLVLGGKGVSRSVATPPAPVTNAYNNDTWYDDTSDGPVTAKVSFKNNPIKSLEAEGGAWVVVLSPNYAPDLKSVRTLWDVLRDLGVQRGGLKIPPKPSFTWDILPIFKRLSELQWVNAGYAAAFGWGGSKSWFGPEMIELLSRTDGAFQVLRQTIANQFRDPVGNPGEAVSAQLLPWQYGEVFTANSPLQYLSLTQTQLQMLKVNWVQGNFEADYDSAAKPKRRIDDYPPDKRPEMLTRAALEFCIADTYHPGIDLTWNIRRPAMYLPDDPFRIRHAPEGWVEPDLGLMFIPAETDGTVGPMVLQVPGGVTRWLSVPWQADTAACKLVRNGPNDPVGYAPTWWPARAPNHVLTMDNYNQAMNSKLDPVDRLRAFFSRNDWVAQPKALPRSIPDPVHEGEAAVFNNMVNDFGQQGIIADPDADGELSGKKGSAADGVVPNRMLCSDRAGASPTLIAPPVPNGG